MMIDTIRLTHAHRLQPPKTLVALGFSTVGGQMKGHASRTAGCAWKLNPGRATRLPRLTWSTAQSGIEYLSAELSLPKYYLRSNVRMIETNEVLRQALTQLSYDVSQMAEVEFDAFNANVVRVDYCNNFRIKEPDVYAYLAALSRASFPRMMRQAFDDSSVWFTTKSKQQQVAAYAKHAQMSKMVREGEANDVELPAASGVLRLEHRFKYRACQGLAERLDLPDRRASSLLTQYVWSQIMKETLAKLGIDKQIGSGDARLGLLRDRYGTGRTYRQLAGFIALCDEHGPENLVPLKIWSRASFYSYRREVQQAGAWLFTNANRVLPPLRLVRQERSSQAG